MDQKHPDLLDRDQIVLGGGGSRLDSVRAARYPRTVVIFMRVATETRAASPG